MSRWPGLLNLLAILLPYVLLSDSIAAQTLTLQNTMVRSSNSLQAAFEGHQVKTNQFYRITSKRYFDTGGMANVGLVEVYDARSNTHLLTIHNPAPEEDDYFGESFAISGHLLIVGSSLATTATRNDFAYIYDLRSSTPELPVHNLTQATMSSTDSRGLRVDIDGDLVVVGAYFKRRVFVYDLSNSQPTEPILNIAGSTSFGSAVAVSGNKVAVGASFYNGFVYDLDSPTPGQPIVTINAPNGRSGYFGSSIDIEGNVVVLGDHYRWEGWGHVFVHRLDSPDPSVPFLTLTHPTLPKYSHFGFSHAISGERIIVSNNSFDEGGEVFLYDLKSANPSEPIAHITDPANLVGFGEFFGYSIDIQADQIIIGSPLDTLTDNFGAGYIYSASSAQPGTPIGKVSSPTPNSSEDEFGNELALSETHLAISTSVPFGPTNVVEVYRRDALGSAPEFVIEEPVPGSFGFRMDMEGRWLIVSALFARQGNIENAGAAFVYDLQSSNPTEPVYELRDPTPDPYDYFGSDVAIDGNLIAVGCYGEGPQRNGAVYLFDLSSTDPEIVISTIDNPGAQNDNSQFGRSVAMENGILVVGASYQNNSQGAALVYDLNVDVQNPPKTLLPNPEQLGSFEFTQFGWDVSISGNWICVSADAHHGIIANEWRAGSCYAYDIEGVDLSSTATLQPNHWIYNPTPAESEHFGRSISVSNGILAVGTWLENSTVPDGGAVYLYNLESVGSPSPSDYMTVPNGRDDWFGWRVIIDSNFLAVGAPHADDRASDSGAVYVYRVADLNEVTLDSVDVVSGVVQSGGVAELQESDNVDFSLTRDLAQIQAVIEFEVNGHCSNQFPVELKFTLEGSVFAREAISQTIEMFNYSTNQFEQMDIQSASRFNDLTVEIVVADNPRRFVSPITGDVRARIRFQAATNRLRYAAHVDHVAWEVE